MSNPLVSIVIPVYNGSNYMREAIDSALNQTYENCEVIVVNDGSNDGGKTDTIARSYGDRIRYFTKENGGVATAVNLGIKNMRGEYFSWLSHDDIYMPDKIEKQVQVLENVPNDIEIAHGNFEFLKMPEKKQNKVDWLKFFTKEELEHGAFAPLFLAIHGSTVMIRRSCFERVGLYREDFPGTQDSEFLFRAMRGHKSCFLENCLIIGRLHSEQGQKTMHGFSEEFNQTFIDMASSVKKEEMEILFGTERNFYYRLYLAFLENQVSSSILDYLIEKVNAYSVKNLISSDGTEKIMNGKSRLYIFGAGVYGRKLLFDLKMHNIEINGWIDNNLSKQGKIIEGYRCESLESILNYKMDSRIIVSMLSSEEVINQLKEKGFTDIQTYRDLRNILKKYEPIYNGGKIYEMEQ